MIYVTFASFQESEIGEKGPKASGQLERAVLTAIFWSRGLPNLSN